MADAPPSPPPSPLSPTASVATNDAPSLSEQAYQDIRRRIISLEFGPGDVLVEDDLRALTGIGRTPVREALQRLAREHFVQVIPRRGMFVTGVDVAELATLLETRSVLEPYAARLAAAKGTEAHWAAMDEALSNAEAATLEPVAMLDVDRRCHEIMWDAADNRFLLDPLDMLYAQGDRLWHLYLSDVSEMEHAVSEHGEILEALRAGDGDGAAALVERHVRSFDEQIREAVKAHLDSPLAS